MVAIRELYLEHLTYGLIEPPEMGILQQMVQGTKFSSMYFNLQSFPIFIASSSAGIVGFTYGHKGYGDQSHVLIIDGTYLYHPLNDLHHQNELQLAFIRWAEKSLEVTHYKLDHLAPPKSIDISHVLPSPLTEKSRETEDLDGEIQESIPPMDYAYH